MKKFVSIGWKASTSIKEIFVDLIIYLNANNVNICPRAKIPEIYYLLIVPIATESNFFSRTVSLTVYLVGVWACDKKKTTTLFTFKRRRTFPAVFWNQTSNSLLLIQFLVHWSWNVNKIKFNGFQSCLSIFKRMWRFMSTFPSEVI